MPSIVVNVEEELMNDIDTVWETHETNNLKSFKSKDDMINKIFAMGCNILAETVLAMRDKMTELESDQDWVSVVQGK